MLSWSSLATSLLAQSNHMTVLTEKTCGLISISSRFIRNRLDHWYESWGRNMFVWGPGALAQRMICFVDWISWSWTEWVPRPFFIGVPSAVCKNRWSGRSFIAGNKFVERTAQKSSLMVDWCYCVDCLRLKATLKVRYTWSLPSTF